MDMRGSTGGGGRAAPLVRKGERQELTPTVTNAVPSGGDSSSPTTPWGPLGCALGELWSRGAGGWWSVVVRAGGPGLERCLSCCHVPSSGGLGRACCVPNTPPHAPVCHHAPGVHATPPLPAGHPCLRLMGQLAPRPSCARDRAQRTRARRWPVGCRGAAHFAPPGLRPHHAASPTPAVSREEERCAAEGTTSP